MMTTGRVTAVVVRWRGGREVDRCLDSLLAHGGPELARVVLVDSGSGDGGAERLRAAFPRVEILPLPENRSFAWAASRGADRCDGPFLLLLNPDARVEPRALDELVSMLEHRESAAGVVPLLVNADGSSQHCWQLRRLPSVNRLALGLAGPPQFGSNPPDDPRLVAQPAASAWLIRKFAWDSLHGLDPLFAPAWWEDVDFCARLAAAVETGDVQLTEGFSVVPSARVVHEGGSSLGSLSDIGFLTAYHVNLLRYSERHHPNSVGLIRTGLVLSLGARALARPARRSAYIETVRVVRGWTAEKG